MAIKTTIKRALRPVVLVCKSITRPQNLLDQWAIFRDWKTTHRQMRVALKATTFPAMSKNVLVLNVGDRVLRHKIEGLFSYALKTQGARSYALISRKALWAHKYLPSYGCTDFIYTEDLLAATTNPEQDDTDARQALKEHSSFDALMQYKRNGKAIGRHALSTTIRMLRTSHAPFNDPAVQAELLHFIKLELHYQRAAELLFEKYNIDYVMTGERGYHPYSQFIEEAQVQEIDVVQWIRAHVHDAFVFKRYSQANQSWHPFSFSQPSWETVLQQPWGDEQTTNFRTQIEQSYAKGEWFNRKYLLKDKEYKTPTEVKEILNLDPNKKTAVIFSHILWDATFFYGTSLFKDYEDWFIQTVKAAIKAPQVNWVIKLHPDYAWKFKQERTEGKPDEYAAIEREVGTTLPDHIKIVAPETPISTYSFFAITDYCITVRGTIGIEAPCFGIPTYTAGTGRYNGLGFTRDSDTAAEYLTKIENIGNEPAITAEEERRALIHAYYLFNKRPWFVKSFAFAKPGKLTDRLNQNLHLAIAPNTLPVAEDLQMWASWMLQDSDEDYLKL